MREMETTQVPESSLMTQVYEMLDSKGYSGVLKFLREELERNPEAADLLQTLMPLDALSMFVQEDGKDYITADNPEERVNQYNQFMIGVFQKEENELAMMYVDAGFVANDLSTSVNEMVGATGFEPSLLTLIKGRKLKEILARIRSFSTIQELTRFLSNYILKSGKNLREVMSVAKEWLEARGLNFNNLQLGQRELAEIRVKN